MTKQQMAGRNRTTKRLLGVTWLWRVRHSLDRKSYPGDTAEYHAVLDELCDLMSQVPLSDGEKAVLA